MCHNSLFCAISQQLLNIIKSYIIETVMWNSCIFQLEDFSLCFWGFRYFSSRVMGTTRVRVFGQLAPCFNVWKLLTNLLYLLVLYLCSENGFKNETLSLCFVFLLISMFLWDHLSVQTISFSVFLNGLSVFDQVMEFKWKFAEWSYRRCLSMHIHTIWSYIYVLHCLLFSYFVFNYLPYKW